MVAEIAFSFLDTNTRAVVHQYLGNMTIEEAGSWMDEMRSNHTYDYMKTWHYIDIPKGDNYVPGTKEENAANEITRVIAELQHKEKMSDEQIRLDILILFHLVGDLGQPLHTGYTGDKGGNDIQVKYLDKSSNLHRVWDSEIIESEHITVQQCMAMAKKYNKARFAEVKKIDMEKWVNFSRNQLDGVYDFKDNTIDQVYVNKNKPVVEEDIFVAGVHLYSVLEQCFKK